MKKSKAILAAAVAAVFATATAGALVACNETDDGVFEITFDANEGSFASSDPVVLTTVAGHLLELPSENPTRTDYTFTGWNLLADGTGETVTFATDFEAATTVYAQWKKKSEDPTPPAPTELSITFDANGGELVAGGITTVLKASNGKITVALPQVKERDGWTFGGWNEKADGTGAQVTSLYNFTSAITVFAKWTRVGDEGPVTPVGVFTITFDANQGKWDDESTTKTIDTLNGVLTSELPANPSRDGYTFLGWNTKADGTGSIVTASTQFNASIPVYAKWLPDAEVHTGTFAIDGGAAQELVYNGKPAGDDAAIEFYKLGLELEGGQALSFTVDGEPLTFVADGRSHGATKSGNTMVAKAAGGTYDIYVRYYENDGEGSDNPPVWTVEMNDGVVEEKNAYYLVGTMNDWAVDAANKLTKSTLNAEDAAKITAQYEIKDVTLAAGVEISIKLYKDDGDVYYGEYLEEWVSPDIAVGGAGEYGNNISIVTEGTYDIYLKFYKGGDIGIYIGTAGGEQPDIPDKVVTVNGTEMTDNTANINKTLNPTQTLEYQATLDLESDATVSFTVDDKTIQVWVEGVTNIAITNVGSRTTSFKTKAEGAFTFTLKYYTDGGEDNNGGWTVYVVGPTEDIGEEPELVEGAYYLVGGKYGFVISGYMKLDSNGSITVDISANQEFKIAKNAAGSPDWDDSFGFAAVKVGKGRGYVSSGNNGNMKFKETGTYTITLNGTDVEITSSDVTEPVITGPTVGPLPDEGGIWLVGAGLAGGGWDDGVELEKDGSVWKITVELSTGWLKIRTNGKADGSGTNNLANTTYAQKTSTDNNFAVKSAGTYTITWDGSKITVEPA